MQAIRKRKEKRPVLNLQRPDMGIQVPKSGSSAFIEYFVSFRKINNFLDYLLRMASHIEASSNNAHKVLVETAKDESEKQRLIKNWESRKGPIEELKRHRQFLLEVILVRHVENYLNFLSTLLKEVFLTRPEVLRSAEKIDLDTVLRHDSIEDLVLTIAERKVDALSYSSFADLVGYFKEKFHIDLVAAISTSSIVEAIETRNISVHNRCIVNQRFVSRTGMGSDQIGHLRKLGLKEVEFMIEVIAQSVISVDKEARKRLKIKGHRFNTIDNEK